MQTQTDKRRPVAWVKRLGFMLVFSAIIATGNVPIAQDAPERRPSEEIEFLGLPNDGLLELSTASRAYQDHLFKSLDYYLHSHTPGFLRKSVQNVRVYDPINNTYTIKTLKPRRWFSGPPMRTDRMLDFILDSNNKAFFKISLPNGEVGFTRDGRMWMDPQGRLVTLAGSYPYLAEDGVIFISNAEDITISREGTVFEGDTAVAKLDIAVFGNFNDMNENLHSLNGVIYILKNEVDLVDDPEQYAIRQGWVSQSNTHMSYDSKFYKNAFNYAFLGIEHLLDARRTINDVVGP